MGTTVDKLLYMKDTKDAIKNAIIEKGVEVGDDVSFRDYASKISNITSGGFKGSGWSQEYYESCLQKTLDEYPLEYLVMPEPASTEQVCYILVAIFDTDSNFTAFTCSGDYIVDWGDGTVENYSSGTKAEHEYIYSNENLNSDTVANFGYKQAMIVITMQAGQTLTSLNFDEYHTTIGPEQGYDTVQPFLCISIAGKNLSYIALAKNQTYVTFRMLKYLRIEENSIADMSYMLQNSSSLSMVPLLDMSSTTNISYMFQNCSSLRTAQLVNTSSVTNMRYAFYSCFSLVTIPLIDTSSVTSMLYGFAGCFSLATIPPIDTSSVTSMSYMFNNCFSLTMIPLLDTSSVTSMSYMFYNCSSLLAIPLLDTSSVTSMSYMFNNCSSLIVIPELNTKSGTSISSILSGCYSLKRVKMSFPNTINLSKFKLSANALNEIYTNLATVTGKNIIVSGNWGAASDNPSIATAKGWTVVG